MRALVLVSIVVLCGCSKKSDKGQAPPMADQQQQLGPDLECASFGQTVRSLSFRKTAHTVATTVPAECRAEWGRRIDVLAASFWMRLDCANADTQALLTLYKATPESARQNPETFPANAEGQSSVTLTAFHEAVAPVVTTTVEDLLTQLDAMGDGGCARSR